MRARWSGLTALPSGLLRDHTVELDEEAEADVDAAADDDDDAADVV